MLEGRGGLVYLSVREGRGFKGVRAIRRLI